jgi:hypothetical protein
MSWIVSRWAHSSWPRACSQPLPVPEVVFFMLFLFFSTELWATNELDCAHVSSQLMDLGLLRATTDTGNGFLDVNLFFFTWILSCQSTCVWAAVQGPRLAHNHCWYLQWILDVNFYFFHLNSELSICWILSLWVHSSWPWACSQPLLVPAVDLWRLNLFFLTWIRSYQRARLWAFELTAWLVHSHCRYLQWIFGCWIFFPHLNSELLKSLIVSIWAHR